MKIEEYIRATVLACVDRIEPERLAPIVFWCERRGILEGEIVQLHDGSLMLADDAYECDRCGDFYPSGEMEEVRRSWRNNEQFCPYCTGNYTFYCERSGTFYSDDMFTAVEVDGEVICLEVFEGDLYYRESTDTYHWEPESNIPGYHCSPKPWRDQVFNGLVYGVEFETAAKYDREEIAAAAVAAGLHAEQDGSLDPDCGVEIIGEPMPFEAYQGRDSPWRKFFEKTKGDLIEDPETQDPDLHYGIHVSISRKAISDYHAGKMLVFVNDNQFLCERIAGRSHNDFAEYKRKKIVNGKEESTSRYDALALRGRKRIELRIFKTFSSHECVLKCVEFTAALVEFTRFASARKLTAGAFCSWLEKPENKKRYKTLFAFLQD